MRVFDYARARNRLRLAILLFVLALALPSLLLVSKAYEQMKWEAFRQQQLLAEELTERINASLVSIVRREDARAIEAYGFLIDRGGGSGPAAARSRLAELPAGDPIPGLIGWFQVAADGTFSSPIVPGPGVAPAAHGLDAAEVTLRRARAERMRRILIGNRLVERGSGEDRRQAVAPAATAAPGRATAAPPKAEAASERGEAPRRQRAPERAPAGSNRWEGQRLSQAAFEELARDEATPALAADEAPGAKRTDQLQLDEGLALRSQRAEGAAAAKSTPPETSAVRPPPASLESRSEAPVDLRLPPAVQLFENAVEPFEVGFLDSGHLLLFRTVSRPSGRVIQGLLIEQQPFLDGLIRGPFAASVLAQTTHLIVAYRGQILAGFRVQREVRDPLRATASRSGAAPLSGSLLYRTRMQEPFGGLELIYSVERLPYPAGASVIGWMAGILALVLVAGAWSMHRLGLRQLALVRQQQDFVSAVSHELKTPLTSIRLYAEMLSAGLASQGRKQTYYRFIHEESERLSRLIANVLQLARIGRGALTLEPRALGLGELMETLRERVASQVERAGFALEIGCDIDTEVLVDPDAFVQIVINLVDNALKFSADAETRLIRIGCGAPAKNRVWITVRDFGPGIPRGQRRRVFDLFYRGPQANAAPGTGIGLALVGQLARAMNATVEISEAGPGTEVRIAVPERAQRTRPARPPCPKAFLSR